MKTIRQTPDLKRRWDLLNTLGKHDMVECPCVVRTVGRLSGLPQIHCDKLCDEAQQLADTIENGEEDEPHVQTARSYLLCHFLNNILHWWSFLED